MTFYAKVENGSIIRINVTEKDARKGLVNFDGDFAAHGFLPITGTEPSYDRERQRLSGPTYQIGAGVVERVWTVAEIPLAERIAKMASDLAAKRYDVETSGVTLGETFVNTDRDTQAKLIAARIMAKEDATYSVNWKLPTGFVTLDAPTIIAIADGVRAHVQAAFDREKALLSEIEAATTHAALDAIDINTGWPG